VTGGGSPTGIVLAGGRSQRFGSDKLAAVFEGEPLLWYPIRALAGAGCEPVVVVIGPQGAEPALPVELAGIVRFARDPRPFGGPLVGLGAGLAAAPGSVAIVAAGDQPRLLPDLLRTLADNRAGLAEVGQPGGRSVAAAILVDPAGVARPLPCVLDRDRARSAASRLLAGGETRLWALLAGLEAREVPEIVWRPIDPAASWTFDVDLPADLPGGN
jgi:molybdopterin-guanine dinucleotide biosynthesis protein A